MGHPRALLDQIANDVRPSYPDPPFSYVYEKALKLKDWKNQPDIQVLTARRVLLR
jgi:hypothetical protein